MDYVIKLGKGNIISAYKTCSYDAIDKIDGNFVVNEENCIYCGACKNACPARAFLFERNFKDSIEGI